MLYVASETDKSRERVHQYLRQCYDECRPFLDRSIKLGFPPAEDVIAINRYYERKHRRGEYGTYWPLHQVEKGFGAMRPMRSGKRK
jgi:hypothetical protein